MSKMIKKHKKMAKIRQKNRQKYPEATFVPAGVLIGIGYGFLANNIPAWTLIGLGLGFAVMAIIRLLRKKR